MRRAFSMVLFSFFVLICPLALFAQVEDTTPPAIESLDFTPKMVDVSAGSQSITVTARITDNLSGFNWGWFGFQSPTGTQGTGAWFSGWARISGDSNDGDYQFEVHIPQFSEAGDWRVPNFQIYDLTGNFGNYSGDYLAAQGFPTILHVVSDPSDTTPPTIQSLDFTPKTVDVSAGSQSITVTARITDNLSGFNSGWFGFQSPTGTQGTGAWFSGWARISGDSNDGDYQFEVHIPQFSEAGDWRIPNFQIYDSTGNFGSQTPPAERVA